MSLTLNLLGGFALEDAGRPVAAPSRKARALLAALALARHRTMPRARLAGLLWEASDDELARTSLRQALAQLRRSGIELARADADSLTLPDDISVDVDGFLAAIARNDTADAARLYRGDLLEGQAYRDPAIEEWLRSERARLRDLAIAALQAELDRIGDRPEVDALAQRLLALDPLREAGHRALMRLEAARGHPTSAFSRFHALRDLLRRELDTSPEPDTVALFEQLRSGRRQSADPPGFGEAPAGPTAADIHLRQVVVLAALETGEAALEPLWQDSLAARIEAAGGAVARREHGQLLACWGLERSRTDAARHAAAIARQAAAEIGEGLSFGLLETAVVASNAIDGLDRIHQRALRRAASAEPGGLAMDPDVAERLGKAIHGAASEDVAPFVGRDAEIAQIMGAIDGALRTGSGLVVHLSGEAGIGKTRLAREIASRHRVSGFVVGTIGFDAFGTGSRHVGEQIVAALPDDPPIVADPFDRAVLGVLRGKQPDTSDELRLSALAPAERRRREIALIRRCLAQAARTSGTLLVIEDCHWAPDPAAEFLLDLTDEATASPVVFLLTERPGDDSLAPRIATRGRVPLARVQLAPLTAAAAHALANTRNAPPERIERALARAGGHPLFLLHLLESERSDDVLPPTIAALVQEQIERLQPGIRTALRQAAIFGRRVDAAAFEAVFGTAPPPPIGDLLVRDGPALVFGHDLVHRAIYESLPNDIRQGFHARAAAHFRDGQPLAWADHALLAADDDDACRAAAAAANAMMAARRYRAAMPYIDAAFARDGDPEVMAEIHSCRAGIRRVRGDLNGALEDYRAAHAKAIRHRTQVAMLVRMALVLHRLERGEEADRALDDAESIASRAGLGGIALAEIYEQRGNRAFVAGDHAACARNHSAALALCEPTGNLRHIARAHGGVGDAAYAAGRMRTAVDHFDRAIALAQEGGYGLVVEEYGYMRAYALHYADPGPRAALLMDLAVDSASASGARRSERIARQARAEMRIAALDFEGAAADIARALELQTAEPEGRFVDDTVSTQALLAYRNGDPITAERLARQGIDGAGERPFAGGFQFGVATLALRDPAERRLALEQGSALVARSCISHGVLLFRRYALEAALRRGDREVAATQIGALRAYTAEESLGWVDLVVENGELSLHPDARRIAEHLERAETHCIRDLAPLRESDEPDAS